MTARIPIAVLAWHVPWPTHPGDTLLYLFSPPASEALHVADIFQVTGNDASDLISCGHPEVGAMAALDPSSSDPAQMGGGNMAPLVSRCRWNAGRSEALDLCRNEIQNLSCHTYAPANFLVRTYRQTRAVQR